MDDFADADEYQAQVDEAMTRFGSIEPMDAEYGGGGVDFGQGGGGFDDDDAVFFSGRDNGKKGKKTSSTGKKSGHGRLRRF